MGRTLLTGAWVVVAATGCYAPTIPECSVRCDQGACPSGLACENDGYCHHSGTSACPGCEDLVTGIGAGDGHTCAVTASGAAWCFGNNVSGQLGAPSAVAGAIATPMQVVASDGSALVGIVEIHGGSGHTCARTSDGSLWCWGKNDLGQLGDGTTNSSSVPIRVLVPAVSEFALGEDHTCAVIAADDTVRCWGSNSDGQLGPAAPAGSSAMPVEVPGITGAVALAAGRSHTCAVAGRTIECWGANDTGQLGDGSGLPRTQPVTVVMRSGGGVLDNATVQIAAGYTHTCALAGSSLWCWGAGGSGELGLGTTANALAAAQVTLPDTGTIAEVAARGQHSCTRVAGRSLYCWGENADGELGNGTSGTNVLAPTLVPLHVMAITAGANHTCAVDTTGRFACWGKNVSGQLGTGTTSLAPVPDPQPVVQLNCPG